MRFVRVLRTVRLQSHESVGLKIPSAPKTGSLAGIGVVAAQYAVAQHMAAHNSVTVTRRSSSVCDCLGPRKRYTSVGPGSLDVVDHRDSSRHLGLAQKAGFLVTQLATKLTRFLSNADQSQAGFCQ
jgi:hypothetical protein